MAKVKVEPENKTVKPQTVTPRDPKVKYRCDFKSYKEYNNYKGVKA